MLAAEHAGWTALCASRGGEHYGALMTPDALMVVAGGMVLDRATIASTLDDAPPWDTYEISEARVVRLGDDCAALVYRASSVRGDDPPFAALMTSVYRRERGELRLALYQQTPTG
ncbi:nuclear transport factor 2 family protein [Cellulosimicrobium sp. CUA-896]|uniref:nuclear transport factor 2 family protein n=1 Tax=Cellulosimicrobium sp. CUA-896 TaxID=1517881 RepID=UPI0021008F89|nr:nuclear transport factor 2 family protein [Cellulosimicrobium sp. CUA-896]